VAKELMQQAEREQREVVLAALAMAAAESGCQALLPWVQQQLASATDRDQQWLAQAHAILAVGTPVAILREWLASPPLRASAMLLARTCADAELEQPLLALVPQIEDDTYSEWLLHSLGAIGGNDTRRALATDLRRNPPREPSTKVDPRRLALLRLGDIDQRKWVLGQLRTNGWRDTGGVTSQVVGPGMVRMAELLGKWGIVGAAAELATLTADQQVLLLTRSHAARGLCWLRDPCGLLAAASLLQQELAHRLDSPEAYTRCQEALHQFVANPDRPVYVPLQHGSFRADPATGSVGAAWQAWLEANAKAIVWRLPRFVDDMVLWP